MDTANGWRFPPLHSLAGNNGGNYGYMRGNINNSKGGGGFNNFSSNNSNISFAGINKNNYINGSNVGNLFNPHYPPNIGSNLNTFGENQNARMNVPCDGNIGHQNMMNSEFNGQNDFCSIGSFNPNGNFPRPLVNKKVDQGPSNTGAMHANPCDAGIPDGYQRAQCTQPAVVVHCCPEGTCILIGNGIAGNVWPNNFSLISLNSNSIEGDVATCLMICATCVYVCLCRSAYIVGTLCKQITQTTAELTRSVILINLSKSQGVCACEFPDENHLKNIAGACDMATGL
uniref:C-type lectin domain-containing protein n=1 Tax=Ascaris lumbricoides TaxID=6252 RepID=A0A0M3I6R4_ASCLU